MAMTGTPSGNSNHRVSTIVVAALLTCTASSFPLHWNCRKARRRSLAFGVVGAQLHSSSPSADYDSCNSVDKNNYNDVSSSGGVGGGSRRTRRNGVQAITNRTNFYQVLGADPTMTRAEIKRLYIALAKETHPDAFPSSNTLANTIRYENDRFNEISQAWSILSDSKTRRAHDRELAAQDFIKKASEVTSEVTREYGPAARKFYDDFAIPLLRRTTATTVAGLSAVVEEVATSEWRQQQQQQQHTSNKKKIPGVTLSEIVEEISERKRVNLLAGDALEDFGRAFQRVIDASKNATRQIDGLELKEKSADLRRRADEAHMESMEVLKQLTEIRLERLRLTFHSSHAEFTSSEAIQYLNDVKEGDPSDHVTLLQRMTFKHPIKQDIEAFSVAEMDFDVKVQEKMEIEQQLNVKKRAMQEIEKNAKLAVEEEERARKILEIAQKRVVESQKALFEAQKSLRDFDITVKKVDQELSKASTMLKRKRDVVRQELKRKSNRVDGPIFEQIDNGTVRINPGYDRSSMNVMGFEEQTLSTIGSLLNDERRIEGDYLRLVDKSSRLISRSERLRLRSEELIGKWQGRATKNSNDEKMVDSVSVSDEAT